MLPLRFAICLLVILGIAGGATVHATPLIDDDAIAKTFDGDAVVAILPLDGRAPAQHVFVVDRREPSALLTVAEILIDAPKTSPPSRFA